MATPPFPTYFHFPDEEEPREIEGWITLSKGDKVDWGDGRHFKVVEVWLSVAHHEDRAEGMHYYLEAV